MASGPEHYRNAEELIEFLDETTMSTTERPTTPEQQAVEVDGYDAGTFREPAWHPAGPIVILRDDEDVVADCCLGAQCGDVEAASPAVLAAATALNIRRNGALVNAFDVAALDAWEEAVGSTVDGEAQP